MAWGGKAWIAARAFFCLMWIPPGMHLVRHFWGHIEGFEDMLMYLFPALSRQQTTGAGDRAPGPSLL
jgi:hypothetical protein